MEEALSVRAWVGITLILAVLAAGMAVGYLNVKRARGPKERRFVRRACLATWGLVLLFLFCLFGLPSPYRYLSAAGFFVLLPLLMFRWATQHQLVRRIDAQDAAHAAGPGARPDLPA